MQAFHITVRPEDEDIAVALLWEAGTTGIETLPAARTAVELRAYFGDGPTASSIREVLGALSGLLVEPADVPDVDWVARFRETFRGFEVGRFQVLPVWETPRPGPSLSIRVDPGRAFGTGTHETTRLCLLALQDRAEREPLGAVVDVGAGTGILSVAALRLGARRAAAVDLDPEAAASAQMHARLNDVPLQVVRGDGGRPLKDGAFDVVLANLMAPLLLERRAELLALARPGATLILSGLLDADVPAIQAAFGTSGSCDVRRDGEWAAVLVQRARR